MPSSPIKLTEDNILSIHLAIHSLNSKIELQGSTYNVFSSRNSRVKYVHIEEYKFITQNPEKKSFYGHKAKAGSKITWIVYPDKRKQWGLVENGIIIRS